MMNVIHPYTIAELHEFTLHEFNININIAISDTKMHRTFLAMPTMYFKGSDK